MITAAAGDIRTGKVSVDKDGEPLTGTLVDNGSWSSSGLAAGASVTIPAGIHDGTGKVTAKSLADQTPGNLAAAKMLSGVYGYSNGAKVTGNIASMGAQTVTPGNSAKTVSCSGKYMTGNVTVSAVANLTAANIKKGVTVGGVKGTWEGYVVEATDLYNNGVIGSYGLTANSTKTVFNSNSISWYNASALNTTKPINLTGYTGIKIILANDSTSNIKTSGNFALRYSSDNGVVTLGSVSGVGLGKSGTKVTITIPFSANHALTTTLVIRMDISNGSYVTTVYKISLY